MIHFFFFTNLSLKNCNTYTRRGVKFDWKTTFFLHHIYHIKQSIRISIISFMWLLFFSIQRTLPLQSSNCNKVGCHGNWTFSRKFMKTLLYLDLYRGRLKMSAFQHVSYILRLRIPVSWFKKINRNLKIRSYFYRYKMMKKLIHIYQVFFSTMQDLCEKCFRQTLPEFSPNKLKLKQFSYVITGWTMYILL